MRVPALFMVAMAMLLAGCQSANMGLEDAAGSASQLPQLSPNPSGEVFGQGNVRIAMLLPVTAPGNAASVANEIRNGALLALQDFGQNTIQLVIKDTTGQAAGAQDVATQAVQEGASAIIGPLFSSSVTAASAVTLPANRTMFAFSTDVSVARRGIYLMSYTPQADTRRMINYALSQGKRNIHAFIPRNAEGALRESTLREVAGQAGATVNVSYYERSGPGIETAAREAAVAISEADTIYIPEGGQIPNAFVSSLSRSGVQVRTKQVLGSGQWESTNLKDANLEGAIYTGRDVTGFAEFANRYQTTYNSQPGVFAALGYDAVTLVISLITNNGPQRAFDPAVIEDRRGFAGRNGVFRFKSDGTSERGLAVYRVVNGAGQPESPAPTRFTGS